MRGMTQHRHFKGREGRRLRVLHVAMAAAFAVALLASHARAVEAINVRVDIAAIDLTDAVERLTTDSDRIQVSTAPGNDGIVRRVEVRAREAGSNWAVFALANSSDEQIDRLIVVPHYQMVGSKILWPDLGLSRIVNITPSSGDRPDRDDSATADIFRITLDPGTVVTYVLELRTDKLPQIYLWEPDAYKDKVNSFTLYHGIVIGIAGLLALFLTILFVVKGSVMFPAAAALGWAVLVYIGVDFGFWGKVFDMSAGAERVWRASGEAILAATLLVFLFAYLNLNRWHVRYAHIALAWLAFLGALVAVAVVDPSIASGIARLSLLFVAIAGFGLVIYLAAQGFDRAVLLIPTWFLLVSWVLAAGPSKVPRLRPRTFSVSGLVNTLSAATSQSQIRSPAPVRARARRSTSETMPWVMPPAKACCITVKPISITISTRPPSSAGATMSLVTHPATARPAARTQETSRNQVGISRTARSKPWAAR